DRILKNCPEAKVLGTTATPIRYLDGERDMSDELFDEEAVNLPLAEAIQRNILPSPEYVASLYTLNEEADNLLENLSKSALSDEEKKTIKAELEQAKIDWEKTSGVPQILKKYLSENLNNKFIVFCKNKEHLDELEDEVRKWIRKTKLFEDRETYRVYSGYKKSDANLEAFLEAKDKHTAHILLSIDMLNEGIHAPDVGAVLLFRPTESPRIFYQQIGRCLQVGTNSKPIIFDFVNNFQSIRAGDFLNDLQEAGETERELREEFGLSTDYLPEIHVHDESRAILETFQEIDERLGSWEISFQKLLAYKEEHGDCLVPYAWKEDPKLGRWVVSQRQGKKRGRIKDNDDRFKRLEKIGFIWDADAQSWESQYEKLLIYQKEHEDCLVPSDWKEDPKLGRWVVSQRHEKLNGLLEEDKLKRLEKLGFDWDPKGTVWNERYKELQSYRDINQNCLVPRNSKEHPTLARWVSKQRSAKSEGRLSSDRIKKLEDIGFNWSNWDNLYQRLVAYQKKNGDCLVPHDWDDKVLATWIISQRQFKARGKLDSNRIEQLEDIDFTWDARQAKWEANFKKLTDYKEEHGDCLVPRNWHDKKLATWVGTQRGFKNRDKLDDEKFRLLDNLGFVWDASRELSRLSSFELNYQKLVDYKKENKDCLVRSSYKDQTLARWVSIQRGRKQSGKLKSDEIEKLNDLGFVWDPTREDWEVQFQKLVDYKEEHGDCLVPRNWHDKKLATWVGTQRAFKNKGKLEDGKIKRLDQLGFIWKTRLDWDTSFQKLLDFKKDNGHCLVPKNWKDPHLKNWVINQRQRKKRKVLAMDRVKKLEAVGFVWKTTK
ncbi:Helicase associated domain protein, partial [Akkermansiaceae bacterium]|nr:Helicase associated domain protein [Akkermansiaceae bacterium]